ncbi:toxin-antitoxin system YwqK family antitoxin [Chryseobacterium scophthalmum]|uniref:toxin-antitoxin system YwqK family antitoxin n=1 Tax=Chryseobacterium scophthalmum TaxID=59733 RepID=UPI00398AAC98
MIKKTALIISFLFFQILFCQNADPVYYDQDWKVTTKANASYYRLMPMKEVGELVLIQDFYMNGTLQFEGYTFKKDENAYVGDVVWYDENGNDDNFRQYRNDTKNLSLTYYHTNGKIRKKVQYKNGVKHGETIIYSTDGTVLMKGLFEKGKPIGGSFEKVKNSDNYDYNAKVEEVSTSEDKSQNKTQISVVPPPPPPIPETVGVEPQTVELLAPMDEDGNSSKKAKNRKTVTEKIFWKDSKQLAQEIVYEISLYGFKPIGRKNFDKSGKLIQSLNESHFEKYGNGIANGVDYTYYLHNNFATGLKSASSFINGEKSGKETLYFPKGEIFYETNYRNGLKDGEEIEFSENGKLKNKRKYKEGESFNGNFNENVGELVVNLNYVDGVKEGEAIAKNEDQQIVAKGIYKKGEPYNGTFVVETGDNVMELISVENFKRKGLQKVFSYRLENLQKTYTIQNEKLDGMTTFYDDGKIVGTLEYKNDEPYNGTLVGDDKTSVFKNGKLTEEVFFEDRYNKDDIKKQKLYENGILVKVKDYSFTISEKPQDSYEGIFKNGKPFSGYFETEYSHEFKQVDYFENGVSKFQYSNDYLKNMDNYRHQYYDIKSTYKDGKIFDGAEYILNGKQFVIRYWKNGVLKNFDWDLFAMHYFNRIHFELKNNTIEINDMQANKKAVIKIDASQKEFKKELFIDGKSVDVISNNPTNQSNKEGVILYFEENGKIISKKMDAVDQSIESSEGTELFYKTYISINEASSVQEVFNKLSENILSNKLMEETDENRIVAGLQTDSSGKPKDGILITPTQNNTYTLQLYLKGKLMKTVEKISFDKVDEEIRNIEE